MSKCEFAADMATESTRGSPLSIDAHRLRPSASSAQRPVAPSPSPPCGSGHALTARPQGAVDFVQTLVFDSDLGSENLKSPRGPV